jgi:outer membrane protein assembly factor BamA
MTHSKSTHLKKYNAGSIDCGTKKVKKHTRTNTKDLQYNASAGHRLYVKSRGQSSKREQSIRRRTTAMESEVAAKDLCKPTLISSNSKYLADKMLTEPLWSARTWNKNDFDKEKR